MWNWSVEGLTDLRTHNVPSKTHNWCNDLCDICKRSSQPSWQLLFIISLWAGESPVPPPSTVSSSSLSTSAVAPPPQQKPGSSLHQDRKVPPPIGTERLARIRQTGSVNPPLLTTSYTASVGQGGIWSFGVGSASGKSEFSVCICRPRRKELFQPL